MRGGRCCYVGLVVRTGLLLSSCLLGACHPSTVQTEAPDADPAVHPPAPPETSLTPQPTVVNPPTTAAEPAWTPAPRKQLCTLALEDLGGEGPVLSCKLGWGEVVAGGRIDLLEIEVDDEMTYGTVAVIVLQPPGEEPAFEHIAEAHEVPGESTSYEISLPEVEGQTVRLRIVDTTTTFPNTGDPDSPSGEYDETTRRTLVCDVADGFCREAETSPNESRVVPRPDSPS